MKDLYKRLDLSPDASEYEIRARLSGIDDQKLERAGQEILLRPNRKEVYDRNYRTLNLIGKLRSRLDLNYAPNWKDTDAEDFQRSSADSLHRDWRSNRSSTSRTSNRSSPESKAGKTAKNELGTSTIGALKVLFRTFPSIIYLVIISICGIAVWGVSFFDESGKSSSSNEPSAVRAEESTLEDTNPEVSDDLITPEQIRKKAQQLREEIVSTDSLRSLERPITPLSDQEGNGEGSFAVPPKSLPPNGRWWKYTAEELIAPLRISVSEGRHYYIKINSAFTDEKVITLFVRSGATAEVDVPTGSYNLKYAIGETWYGRENYFGPETQYMEADDIFNFEVVGQKVRGHKVELIVQSGGNLPTNPIPKSEF